MEKKKEKSKDQWQDRLDSEKNKLQDRLSKREAHIQARKKGIDVSTVKPDPTASKDAGLPPAKHPRLFMAIKHNDKDGNGEGGGEEGGGRSKSTSSSPSSGKQNRAGFEGKKQGFLNKSKNKGK